MRILRPEELPIGFGIGKTKAHWDRVYSAILISSPMLNSSAKCAIVSDILSIEDVAHILRCGVDRVRRIPRDELLARNGPGRGLLYLREDLMAYIKQQPCGKRRNSGFSSANDSSDFTKPEPAFDIEQAKELIKVDYNGV